MKNKRELIIYVVALALSVALWFVIPTAVPMRSEGASFVNSRFFPRVIAVVAMLLSALGIITESLKLKRSQAGGSENMRPPQWASVLRVLGLAVIMFLYAIALEPLGFIISTIGVVVLILLLMGERKPLNYLVVLAVCAVIYALFTYVLKVRLP